MRFKISQRALQTEEKPSDIVIQNLKNSSIIIQRNGSKVKSMCDSITSLRSKKNIMINNDDIPENIKYTFSNEKFLQYDSGILDEQRIVIFSTETHLNHLKYSNTWFCDGTFSSSPKKFTQIYVIMAKIRNLNIPLVYIFMKRKSKTAYSKIFEFLKCRIDNKYPQNIILDFEMAAYVALSETFPNSTLNGYFSFHTNTFSSHT